MAYYNKIKEIQKLAWNGDDRIDQDALFELQEKIAYLALEIAQKENKTDDLIENFKYLYITESK
jgi:hypothetical protein